jgi:replicative DNA helicase
MRNEDGQPLIAAVGKLSGAPMFIDDTPGITLMELRAKLRRLVRVHNVRVAVVDYFGLMGVPDVRHKREFLEEISKGMKMLAKELRITLVCLAQLNRESEREKSRKPQMADLRDCGSLEQDADLVGLLYEPRMDGDEEEQMAAQHGNDWSQVSRRINLLVAKQRNGPTGDCQFLFKKSCMRFEEYRRSEASAKYDKRAAPKEGKRQVVDLDL